MEEKTCPKCGRSLPLSFFYKHKNTKNGYTVWCKECKEKSKKKYRAKNREKVLKQEQKYRETNREEVKKRCRDYYQKIRIGALKKLDDPPKCKMCGTTDIRVLSIDHKNNDGYSHRKRVHNVTMYKNVSKMDSNDAKKLYQILCRNCNWIKHLERQSDAG